MKSWYCGVNDNYVLNILGFWIAQDSEYVSGSKCARVLEILGFWMCLWFWICQDSEYDRVTQGSEHAWIIAEYAWIRLIMSGYVWICLNMPEYAGICVNMPKFAWMAFVLRFPISPFILQFLFYLNTWLLSWTSTRD